MSKTSDILTSKSTWDLINNGIPSFPAKDCPDHLYGPNTYNLGPRIPGFLETKLDPSNNNENTADSDSSPKKWRNPYSNYIPNKIQHLDMPTKENLKNLKIAAQLRGGESKSCIVITAASAGYEAGKFAQITMDRKKVGLEDNEKGHYRGLHIVIINPETRSVEWAQVFDTYSTMDGFNDFLERAVIPDGYLVIAACQDDCFTAMGQKCKEFFVKMGSKEIEKLEYRQSFVFIGTMGQDKANEKRGIDLKEKVSVKQIFFSAAKNGQLDNDPKHHDDQGPYKPADGPNAFPMSDEEYYKLSAPAAPAEAPKEDDGYGKRKIEKPLVSPETQIKRIKRQVKMKKFEKSNMTGVEVAEEEDAPTREPKIVDKTIGCKKNPRVVFHIQYCGG